MWRFLWSQTFEYYRPTWNTFYSFSLVVFKEYVFKERKSLGRAVFSIPFRRISLKFWDLRKIIETTLIRRTFCKNSPFYLKYMFKSFEIQNNLFMQSRIFSIVAIFFWQFNILHYPQNLDGLPSGYFDRWSFLRDHSIEITTTQTIQHYLTVLAKFLPNWSKLGIRLISLFGKSCWGNFFPSSVSEPAFFLFLPQKISQSPCRF